jgi:hypothetical protein
MMRTEPSLSSTTWLLWLVALFVGSLELGWWFFWNVMAP